MEQMDRRGFLMGLALGVVGGGAGAWFALRSTLAKQEASAAAAGNVPALDHAFYIRRAIAQAKLSPKLPFGAVIVNGENKEVVAEGHNRSEESPSYHGEVDVINRYAAQHPGEKDWSGLILYTTAEPCPMCQSAIEWAGIGAVVYGSSIPFLKSIGWWQIDIRAEEVVRRTPFRRCSVIGGILEEECNALYREAAKGLYRD